MKSGNWLFWKAQEKFQEKSCFWKTIGCSFVTFLTTYPAKKTVFKVSNRNTRWRCLLISKITFKTLERCHLTPSHLSGVTLQNHVLGSFFYKIDTNLQPKFCLQFCFQVWRPIISTIVDPYTSFSGKWEIITEIFDSWKTQNASTFYFWKNAPKIDKFFNYLPNIQRATISVSQN